MNALESTLHKYMVDNGVSPGLAEAAAKKCSQAVTENAMLGAALGLTAGMVTANPGAVIMAVALGGIAGAGTALGSRSCQEVRDAAWKIAMK